MSIMLPNTPASLTFAVLVAIAANIAAAVLMFTSGVELGGALATVLALATYVYVYTTIANGVRPFAKSSAGFLAFFNVLLVVSSFTSHQPPIIAILGLVSAVCAGYVYMTLQVSPASAQAAPAAAGSSKSDERSAAATPVGAHEERAPAVIPPEEVSRSDSISSV